MMNCSNIQHIMNVSCKDVYLKALQRTVAAFSLIAAGVINPQLYASCDKKRLNLPSCLYNTTKSLRKIITTSKYCCKDKEL